MKSYTKTKVCYSEQQNGTTKKYITSETAFNKMVKDAKEANEELPTLVSTQTFGYKAAETVDEAVELSGGQGVGEYEGTEVFLGVFNYAASLRQDNAANDVLTDSSFQQTEDIRDVSFAVAEKSEGRQKMTPEEKAAKTLGISADQLRAALAAIQASAASA